MSFVADKVALVTGGAAGIGFAIVKSLLQNGAKGVAFVDFNNEAGTSSLKTLQKDFGNKVIFIHADVTNNAEFEDAFVKTVETFNNLDIVVNNAGIFDETNWERMVAVNLGGTMRGTRLALEKYLPKYKSSEKGFIVNIGSVGSVKTVHGGAGYCATKHAILGLGNSLDDGNKTNINVLTICPGATETQLFRAFAEKVELTSDMVHEVSPPEYIGNNLVDLINSGRRGVWVLEDGEAPYKLKFPHYRTLRTDEVN